MGSLKCLKNSLLTWSEKDFLTATWDADAKKENNLKSENIKLRSFCVVKTKNKETAQASQRTSDNGKEKKTDVTHITNEGPASLILKKLLQTNMKKKNATAQ